MASMGVVRMYRYSYGIGVVVRRYNYRYRCPHNIIIINFPYSTCIISFLAAASLLLCSFLKCFFRSCYNNIILYLPV